MEKNLGAVGHSDILKNHGLFIMLILHSAILPPSF